MEYIIVGCHFTRMKMSSVMLCLCILAVSYAQERSDGADSVISSAVVSTTSTMHVDQTSRIDHIKPVSSRSDLKTTVPASDLIDRSSPSTMVVAKTMASTYSPSTREITNTMSSSKPVLNSMTSIISPSPTVNIAPSATVSAEQGSDFGVSASRSSTENAPILESSQTWITTNPSQSAVSTSLRQSPVTGFGNEFVQSTMVTNIDSSSIPYGKDLT